MKSILLALSLVLTLPAFAKSNFDFTFNLGPSLTQSGGIEDLGTPSLSTGLGFNYFVNHNHGIGLGFNNESSFKGTKKTPEIKDGSMSTFDIHYVYRHIIDKVHIVFEPGFGRQTLFDESNDPYYGYLYHDDISTAFILNYKLFVRYVFTEWNPEGDTRDGALFAGAGLIHNFSFEDSLRGRDISGNRLAGVFQVGIAF